MYLLQEQDSGDWIIAKDVLGQDVKLRLSKPNWPEYPHPDIGYWIKPGNLMIDGLKVTARTECGRSCDSVTLFKLN